MTKCNTKEAIDPMDLHDKFGEDHYDTFFQMSKNQNQTANGKKYKKIQIRKEKLLLLQAKTIGYPPERSPTRR